MWENLKNIEIQAELRIETDSGSVNIYDKNKELIIQFSGWSTLNCSKNILPDGLNSISSLNSINTALYNTGVVINILVKDSEIIKLGKSKKPSLKISKLFGSFFK
ncbi:MAG: hypothetical protein Kapaf2KO_11800 [Candidatus Kapaibacteriales bacterium]